jgi:hypothetical protein
LSRPLAALVAVTVTVVVILLAPGGLWSTPQPIRPASSLHADCSNSEVDFLGYSDSLDEQRYEGVKVGGLSGLTYDPKRKLYYALADGGPEDVPTHFYTLSMPLEQGRLTDPIILDATILRDPKGKPFTGANFDSEAIALTSEGELLVTSETKPEIRRFSLGGRFLEKLPVPQKFLKVPKGQARPNQTFESLALSPSGRTMYTANERSLLIDDARSFPRKQLESLIGMRERVRVLSYTDSGSSSFEPSKEFFYRLDWGSELSELVALPKRELLVLERGGRRIFRVSLDGAENVAGEENLAASNTPPLRKELLVDVDDNCPLPSDDNGSFGLLEGMTLGPELPGRQQTLVMLSDDNYSRSLKTRMMVLSTRLQ